MYTAVLRRVFITSVGPTVLNNRSRNIGGLPNFKRKLHRMVVVAGFGNPLFDVTVKIKDDVLLKKYNLKEDSQKEVSQNNMKCLFDDISEYQKSYSAGGCTQNTLRILQWILNKPNSTYMFGSVGNDEQARVLKNIVENDGVITRYFVQDSKPTGSSVALIRGPYRSLIAHIGAAEYLTIEDLLSSKDAITTLQNANAVYMEGFFLSNRIDVAKYVLNFCNDNKKLFIFNISGKYMCEDYPEAIKYFAQKCDILFGNDSEYTALGKVFGYDGDLKTFAITLNRDYAGHGYLTYGKMAIITRGAESVICAHSYGKIDEIAVEKVNKEDIKDTTGAGDTFVSGFLAAMFENHEPLTCLKWGSWVSAQIIQQVGCTVPNYKSENIKMLR